MAWFKDGSAAVVNGGRMVTLSGAATTGNVFAGDAFAAPDGKDYEIASVTSGTTFQLVDTYAGATASAQPYRIKPLASVDTLRAAAATLAAVNTSYATTRDNAGQGLFGDGTAASPGVRFSAETGSGLYRPGAGKLGLVAAGTERLRLSSTGTGVQALSSQLDVTSSNLPQLSLTRSGIVSWSLGNDPGLGTSTDFKITLNATVMVDIDSAGNLGLGGAPNPGGYGGRLLSVLAPTGSYGGLDMVVAGASRGLVYCDASTCYVQTTGASPIVFLTSGVEKARIDAGGRLLVGVASASSHTIRGKDAAGYVLNLLATNGDLVAAVEEDHVGGIHATAAILRLSKSANGRSIGATGTINASGADYAEYMTKADGAVTIVPGQVVGIDASRKIVTTFDDAHSFAIKSTNPGAVGGDNWADHLGDRPIEPERSLVPPLRIAPYDGPAEPIEPDPLYSLHLVAYADARAAYDAACATAEAGHGAAETAADAASATAKADYDADLAAWMTAYEDARQHVDRIAFTGQVPALITGPVAAGDYIFAERGGDGSIRAVARDIADLDLAAYARRVGKVWAVDVGGTIWVAIGVS